MIDFTVETHIERPVSEVFGYATDPDRLASWQTNTVSSEKLDEGPMRVGTRLREVHRAPGGKELESVVEVSEYERDRSFALRVVEGVPVHAQMTFEPAGDGTLMRFRGHGELSGAMRLAQPLLRRTLQRQFAGQCETLKRVLEHGPADAPSLESGSRRRAAQGGRRRSRAKAEVSE
jgi:uncharacterized protein YndB with AHSA1/START domain